MKMAPRNRRLPYYREPWKDDGDLVAHILRGSVEHFDVLYEAYFPRVYRFALKRLRDPAEAEDVTAEVFFTTFNALPSFPGDSSLLVWIFGITRTAVNRRIRGATPTITPLQRRIFQLKHLRRQSIRAIARAFGISKGSW